MDTLSWNFAVPGSRCAPGVAGANFPVGAPQIGSTVCYPSNASSGLSALDRNATLRSGMLSRHPERPNFLSTANQAEVQLAGQVAPAWNDHMRCDANVQLMQPPTISVSDASPSPRDQDPMAMMGIPNAPASPSRPDLSSSSMTHEATDASQLSSVAPELLRSNTPMAGSMSCMSNRETSFDCSPFPFGGIRRQDATSLKGLLKLDVNMGFMGDAKIDSPTSMLQPVIGWKRRRSVSDVGPKTPSMLGPSVDALTSPIDDLSYLVNSMGSRPHPDKAENITNSHDQNPAFNFESLNLHVDKSQSHSPADGFVHDLEGSEHNCEKTPSLGTEHALADSVDTSLSSELTLNPTYIHPSMPQNSFLDQTFTNPLGDPSLYRPPPTHAKEESAAGPIRTSASSRSSRSVSPYHTPTRSMTPESERSLDENAHCDPAIRMTQWRFPMIHAPHQGDALHPMHAYAHSNSASMLSPGGVRFSHHAKNTRRHMRAAVSEDIRTHEKMSIPASWGNSVDLLRQEHALFANAPFSHDHQPNSSDMMRCVSSPGTISSAEVASDRGFGAGPKTSLSTTRSVSQGASSKVPSLHIPSLSEGALSTTLKMEASDSSLQTAAQTRTPVVTTSAAQAASASRRKAEALFTCPFPDCGSTFTRQYNLRGHMRSHMDERPFKCEWPGCGRSFARTHDCKRHHNLHLNIKPYQCDGCGKTFARLDALNRHHKSEASTCGAKAGESSKSRKTCINPNQM